MAAVTQVRHRHSEGRAYYDRKVGEGKTGKEALRALKRRISDALFAAMVADARRERLESQASGGPGGQTGNGSARPALTRRNRLFGQATPGPTLRLGLAGGRRSNLPCVTIAL
jgi:transposase